MRLASVPFLCTCIACVYLAGCKDENTKPAAVRPARVVVVTPHQLGVVAEGAGLIQSRYDSPVGFEVGGRLVSRYVDIGAVVTKGQKLAKLSDVDYRNRVTAAEARPCGGQGRCRPGCAAGVALPHPAQAGLDHPCTL